MAESAVSLLVEKLAMFVENEVNRWKGVCGDIELIRDEFVQMKAFLASAESSQDDDPELKVWVKQVRDVAYDVEDILDEFTLNMARDHGDGYLHNIKLTMNNLIERRLLSSKIADIKSRVNSIGEGHRRYHSIEKMTNLRSLDVVAESESEIIDLDFPSSPPPLLQRLHIKGYLKKLPHWLPLLNNLARVSLRWSRLKSSPLMALQNLPNLVDLDLENAFEGEKLVFEDGGFPKLKELYLADLENLRFVLMNGQAMPCLQRLFIEGCKRLDWQSLLVVIRGLTLLKYLRFGEMPEEFALAVYPDSSSKMMTKGILRGYYEEVMERNPEVYFVWWEEDQWEWYDLSLRSYNAIKRRVMNRGEVVPEVS